MTNKLFITYSYTPQTLEKVQQCLGLFTDKYVVGQKTGAKGQPVFNVYVEAKGKEEDVITLMNAVFRKMKPANYKVVEDSEDNLIDWINQECEEIIRS